MTPIVSKFLMRFLNVFVGPSRWLAIGIETSILLQAVDVLQEMGAE